MSSLLDDLLDVSRITRGVLLLKKRCVPLRGLLDAAVETAQPLLDAKGHRLDLDLTPLPLLLESDPVRITQVVTNLLTNAAKYTDDGGHITLGNRIESQSVVIYVRDNGIGLAPDMLTRVFDMFTQVEAETKRSDGGLGIGLALVKGLVGLHGGRVEARSAGIGRGSEFLVTLPHSVVAGRTGAQAPCGRQAQGTRRRLRSSRDEAHGSGGARAADRGGGHASGPRIAWLRSPDEQARFAA